MLIVVGLGVSLEFSTRISLEILRKCDEVLVDSYTSFWYPSISTLMDLLNAMGIRARLCKRSDLEGRAISEIANKARSKNVCIVVPGDPFFATTHAAIVAEAKRSGAKVVVIPGVSILNFVYAYTCLQPYRFGKIATVVAPKEGVFFDYPITVVKENRDRNLHTVLLLEIDFEKGFFMAPRQAIEILLKAQERLRMQVLSKDDRVFVLSAIGSPKECVEYTSIDSILNESNQCRDPPATLVIPARRLHPIEEECIESMHIKKLLTNPLNLLDAST